ncbi:MAG: heavy metal sensor histidine kinase [Gemmataceae bacterium]
MSLKKGDDVSRPIPKSSLSLAARLTIWYAGSAFVLILAAVGFMYLILARNLDREDDGQIADQVRVMRDLLVERPGDLVAVRQEAEQEFQSRQHTQVYIRLLDGGGRVLVETPGLESLLVQMEFPRPVTYLGRGEERKAKNGKPFRVMSVRMESVTQEGTEYIIQAAMDRSSEAELLADYRRNIWPVLTAGLLLCILVGYQIARRGLLPVRLVIDTARRIDMANISERIVADSLPADLIDLAVTFNRMLDRLEGSFTRLDQFSADIAHELRTPVNNLRGEVEVALCNPRSHEQYRELLASNLEECERLTRLIESLLFLARAENPKTQIVKESIDVGIELATVCDYYEAVASEKGIKLIVVVSGLVQAELNRPLFQRAVGNLVENALSHTPQGGTITLSSHINDTLAVVEVIDSGTGIPKAHLSHIFDRFYRADSARNSSAGNVGLGLSIIKSIVDLHGGKVEIVSQEASGTRVTMSFLNMTKS